MKRVWIFEEDLTEEGSTSVDIEVFRDETKAREYFQKRKKAILSNAKNDGWSEIIEGVDSLRLIMRDEDDVTAEFYYRIYSRPVQ